MNKLTPEPLRKLGIRSGFYEFDEGVEDEVFGFRDREGVSFANRFHIQREYLQDPDLNNRDGFVGLWASFSLKDPRVVEQERHERLRMRRELPSDVLQQVGLDPGREAPTPESEGVTLSTNPLKGLFQVPNLFKSKPKPKPNLFPTGGQPLPDGRVLVAEIGAFTDRGEAQESGSSPGVGNGSSGGSVPASAEVADPVDSADPVNSAGPGETGPAVADGNASEGQPKRFLGLIPVKAPRQADGDQGGKAGESLKELGRKLFGPSKPQRPRTPGRPSQPFRR